MSHVPSTRPTPEPAEYTGVPPRTRTVNNGRRRSSRGLRMFFFGLAAGWGVLVGAGSTLGLLRPAGASILDAGLRLWWLVPVFVAAVAGGVLISAAYKEARQHTR